MSNELTFLNEIYVKRKKYTDAVRENEFEGGILSLLSDLYPDEAHFVFELLQNAEDAGASKVIFDLKTDHLRVTHDGERLFTEDDVDGITSIAKSPKKDDVNKIGKFGIGFKAVFSYTRTPKIHSGNFNFEISDLVCPNSVGSIDKHPNETVFIFPFNNPDKPAAKCVEEIESVFKRADETFLVFLNNTRCIEWKAEDCGLENGRIDCSELDSNLIEITRSNGEVKNKRLFLRYQKTLPGHGDLKCGIAFPVEQGNKNLRILATSGRMCIFFPAEKENTALRFHINGPYASSIDRASIKHADKGNIDILKNTALLLIEGLEDMKERGLLGLDVLEVLPNKDDSLQDFFKEIRNHLIASLKNKPLVPTRSGDYAPATDLVYGPKQMSDVFSDEQMAFLGEHQGKKWAIGALKNSRAHKLLSSLNIPTWDEDELLIDLKNCFGQYAWYQYDSRRKYRNSQGAPWINKQEDQWTASLYLLLRKILKSNDEESLAEEWKIIRTENGHHYGKGVYFAQDDNKKTIGVDTVKDILFSKLSKQKKKDLKEFLRWTGVQEIGEKQVITGTLLKYYTGEDEKKNIGKTTHLNHMRIFLKWFNEKNDVTIFDGYSILKTNHNDNNKFHRPNMLYLDMPFEKTGISSVYENETSPVYQSKLPLWNDYSRIKGFEHFTVALGVHKGLEIRDIYSTNGVHRHKDIYDLFKYRGKKKNENTINKDYYIIKLEDLVQQRNEKASFYIWRAMINAKGKVLTAQYRPNASWPIMTAPSSLVEILKEGSWIPSNDGVFRKPKEMSKNLLLKDFDLTDNTGWLEAIQFGVDLKQQSQDELDRQAKIKSLGLNDKSVELATRLTCDPELLEQVEEMIRKSVHKPQFPERPTANPEKRSDKVKKNIKESPDKTYVKKQRSIRSSASNVDKRVYLKGKYTNDDGQMVCQICEGEHFKKRDDEYFFEAVEAVSDNSKENASGFIALCPLCAAMYKEWVKKDDAAKQLFIERVFSQEDMNIPIDMDSRPYTVSFVEQHWIDFKAYLDDVKNS